MNDFVEILFGKPCPKAVRGAAVVIGNLDGVHLGHKALINEALKTDLPVVCLSFTPNPREYFTKQPFFYLTSQAQKAKLLEHYGASALALCEFNQQFASLTPQNFIDDVLINWLGAKAVFTGQNFRFGKNREGGADLLSEQFFTFKAISSVFENGEVISSTRIRNHLKQGEMRKANALLGHNYTVSGEVIHGAKRGRDMGFPTANIALQAGNQLKHGIYAVFAYINGGKHQAVASFGTRPMFDNGLPLLETFILDFSGDLYGKTIEIEVIDYLRPEVKFEGIEKLIQQMQSDCDCARKLLDR